METAHDMQDERLASTLSNLFAHGCVAWLQCRLFSEMHGIKGLIDVDMRFVDN